MAGAHVDPRRGLVEQYELRLAEQRAAVAAGDALRLAGALTEQSALLGRARAALAEERSRWPAATWWVLGAASGVVGTVAVLVLGLMLGG